jgi:hypothetical protein
MSSRHCQPDPHDQSKPPAEGGLCSPEIWAGLDSNDRLEILFRACLYYGQHPDPEWLAKLERFYHHCIVEMPEELRMDACYALSQQINALPERPYLALIPFIELETHNQVIGNAALLLATLFPAPPEAPMAGPQWLADRMLKSADSGVLPLECAGVLHGLMMLKDRRLIPLWHQVWNRLNDDGRHQVLRANFHTPATPGAPLIEFHLQLLEMGLPPLLFRMTAEQLVQFAESAREKGIFEAHYHLPFTPEKTNREMATIVAQWDRNGYYESQLKERLEKLLVQQPALARITEKIRAAWTK